MIYKIKFMADGEITHQSLSKQAANKKQRLN